MSDASLRKSLGIPPNADVQVIDMGPGKVEHTTEGWTDDQIRGKSFDEFDLQIRSGELVLEKLAESVKEQENRVASLRALRLRKLQIGG